MGGFSRVSGCHRQGSPRNSHPCAVTVSSDTCREEGKDRGYTPVGKGQTFYGGRMTRSHKTQPFGLLMPGTRAAPSKGSEQTCVQEAADGEALYGSGTSDTLPCVLKRNALCNLTVKEPCACLGETERIERTRELVP